MKKKKILALCLLFTLVVSTLSGNVMALENSDQNINGLCEHHKEHNAQCGYIEGQEESSCNFVCDICDDGKEPADLEEKKIVSKWSWKQDESKDINLPVYKDDHFEMKLPKTPTNKPISKEQVIKLLPKEIDMTLESKEQVSSPVKWEILDYPVKGASSGEFIGTATLPEEYSLKEGVEPLRIYLYFEAKKNNAKVKSGIDPSVLNAHQLDSTISPAGTKINLFDYWLGDTNDDRLKPDHAPLGHNGNPNEENHDNDLNDDVRDKSKGINKNHVFKFVSWGGDWQGYNRWTGNTNPYEGIVADKLDKKGYPLIEKEPKDFTWLEYNNKIYDVDNDKVGSLSYIFDPNESHPGKASYENVKDLLQVDDEGYYYYDSAKNYARFDEKNNKFDLYDGPAIYRNNTNDPNPGQFFPFQSEKEVCSYYKGVNGDGTLELDQNINPASDKVNHYFGMSMETRFVHKNGGKNYKGQDITYEFAGDDDVWVFIDGVLIADLGGIHDKATFDIDFHTGDIHVNGNLKSNIKAQFVAAGKDGEEKFDGNTFADNTYHTLKFFFLERGNHESNMSLRYNLLPIPESELIKVDQMGKPVAGVDFTLYTADEKYGIKEKLFSGTTDEKGYIYLRDEFGMPMTFAQFYDDYGAKYFVLKEDNPAPGYRKLKDVHLHYKIYNEDKNIGVIQTDENNLWETGACAQVKVVATAPNKIRYGNFSTGQQVGTLDLTSTSTVPNDPLMFAVVYQKNGNNWYPISGDALSGWKVSEDNKWKSVFEAAKKNPYIFHLGTSGAFQAEIENLPGDIEEYYSFLKQYGDQHKAKYYVAYYYSTAENLDKATPNNTYQILNQIDSNEEYKDFSREFASRLYVPNIKNSLLVHKTDEKMNPLRDAKFCLYKESDILVKKDGSYEIKENAVPYDEATTKKLNDMDGGIVFPTNGKVLEMGTYYLIESKAPEGFIKNSKAVKIIIDDTGVYADAGDENDNILVARSTGKIVRSMLQFAADDHVNSTLHDIKVQLKTADKYEYEDTKWSKWQQSPPSIEEIHLQYEEDNPVLDYGLIKSEKDEHKFPALVTEKGWSKLEVRQCREHDKNRLNSGFKEDLGDRDLTNVFSGLTTVIVKDETIMKTGSLSVKKTVAGDNGDKSKDWNFTVTLRDTTIDGEYGDMIFKSGVASFTLKDGEEKKAQNLPAGMEYKVVEKEANLDGYTTTATNDVGVIEKDKNALASFVNEKNSNPPVPDNPDNDKPSNPNNPEKPSVPNDTDDNPKTGDQTSIGLLVTILAISLLGMAIMFIWEKRQSLKNK